MIFQVCDYLNETVASTQTLESVTTFSDKCKDFKLAKAEILNIINIRPSVDFKALLDPVCGFFFLFLLSSLPNLIIISNVTYVFILSYSFHIVLTFVDCYLLQIIEEPKERGIDTDGILELVQDLLPPLPVVETQMEKDQDETNNGEES